MIDDLTLIAIQGEPTPEDKEVIFAGMREHHLSQGHPRGKEHYSVLLKDQNNKVMGGVIVSFEWNGMEIQQLWVNESLRGLGWGSKLMRMVEDEALKRGCTLSYTNTFSWQAPEFYEKIGYTLFGKLEDYPPGNSLSYFYKKLD
jgi:ribosomal protein S18 acetylase RimI-like enzyme